MRNWFTLAVGMLLIAGCATVGNQVYQIETVNPGPNERIIVDQAVIIVDSSTSMQYNKIKIARQSAMMLVNAMPDNGYDVGMIAFGGKETEVEGMAPFDRDGLLGAVSNAPFLGSTTPVENSMAMTQDMISGLSGRTAVFLFSDGKPTHYQRAMDAAQSLAGSGDVCIHTVQIGNDPAGEEFLQAVAGLTPCGSYRISDSLFNEDRLREFVRYAFFEETAPTPVPTPEPAPEPTPIVTPPETDSDGDGVIDVRDECPDTPKGAKVDERGCWVINNIYFDYDKSIVKPAYFPILDEVVSVLKQNPDVRIYVDGHCDARGSDEYNQALSERRAEACVNYLGDQGIDRGRLVIRGFGESRPIRPNDTEENMAYNRRVELNVIQ